MDYRFLLPGDICIYDPGAGQTLEEVMIIGSYAMNCDVHMNSRAMVQGGLENHHFNKYRVMFKDNYSVGWVEREELTFQERRGLDYFMRRLYRSQLTYEEVTDKDIIGTMTINDYLKLTEENNVTLLFNPPNGNELLYVTIKEMDEETGLVTLVDEKGETYTDYPFASLYVNRIVPKIQTTLDCCEKHCPVDFEVPQNG